MLRALPFAAAAALLAATAPLAAQPSLDDAPTAFVALAADASRAARVEPRLHAPLADRVVGDAPSATRLAAYREALRVQLGRERRRATRERHGGQALVVAGAAGLAASYAQWVRGGSMGMTGGQVALMAGSSAAAVGGIGRWATGRARAERAERAAEALAAVAPPR